MSAFERLLEAAQTYRRAADAFSRALAEVPRDATWTVRLHRERREARRAVVEAARALETEESQEAPRCGS